MDKNKNLIENIPSAFAYHKIVYDENKKPVDYIYLNVNEKFEKIIGLKKEDIEEKKASDVTENINKKSSEMIDFYGKIALNKENKTSEKYFKSQDKWYEIKVFSKNNVYFTTTLNDITEKKKQEKNIDKRKKINDLFHNLNDIVWSISWPSLEVKFISKAVEDIIGFTVEDFKENPMLLQKITHPEDKKINIEALQSIVDKGYMEREIRLISKEGNIKWIHDKMKMRYDEYGNPIKLEGVMRDITKRKKAEKRLKLHRKRYETIFNSVPVGIIIEDKKGNILEVNRDMCVMSGYTKKELEKSNVIDKFVLPKYKDLACENIKKLINGTDLEHDIKTLKKNGEMRYYYLKETNIELPSEEKGIISMHIDVTERVKQREKLELMSFTVNNSKLLVFRASPKGIIEYINKTVLDKLGYKKEELIGENAKMLLRDENYIKREKFWNQIKNNTSITYERSYVTKDGNLLPVQITSQYFKYEDKEYEFVFAQDITERKRKEREIKYLSYRDPLTDLYNRRFFEKEVNKFDNKKDIQVSIIMADINGLKLINDTYGHEKGDKLLVEAAQLLKRFIREDDILARHGGDEFVIFLPDTSYEHAHKIINRIKNRKKENTKKEIPLSITMGVATRKDNKEKLKDTLKRADNRMYKNKLSESRSAKHRVVENLINTLAAKSSETKEHAVRMTKLAYDLGNKIGLSNSELNKLSLLATLHDIGKTTIAEDILTKPDKLSAEEWEIIKTHTERGYKIVSASEEFSSVAKEVLYHHEKWDGSGYPEGLKGEEIPYLSRMISIIDAYDVMTNDRTYSPAMSVIEALEEIKSCSGSQFDPELAEGFVTLKENGK